MKKKELALESLLDFCHDPGLVLDLHANYDCDVNCSNLFEGLCKLLCKHTVPVANTLTALNVLALDGLFSIVSHIASRCRVNEEGSLDEDISSPRPTDESSKHIKDDELILRKTHKRRLLLAATQFNKAPLKPYWREYAKELGVLSSAIESNANNNHNNNHNDALQETEYEKDSRESTEVARFLLTTPGLDKCAIGEFLSEKENSQILKQYVASFNMQELRIDVALRNVLECFRIPGEAQKIDRVVDTFAKVYYSQNTGSMFANEDAVFILAFSIVMLHTDRHSRSIAENKRMTEEQFVKNVRGINDGKDFDPIYLSQIFKNVSENEFMLSYDSTSSTGEIREWDVILRHSSKVEFPRFSKRGLKKKAGVHERDMFDILFDSTLRSLDSALEITLDGRIVNRSLKCADDLAKIAAYFTRVDELNQIVIMLCRQFFILSRTISPENLKLFKEELLYLTRAETILANESQEDDGKAISFSNKKKKIIK